MVMYVLVIVSGAGTAATHDFKEAETFLQWKNQSIGMCHRTRSHVDYILLLRLKQTVTELLSR